MKTKILLTCISLVCFVSLWGLSAQEKSEKWIKITDQKGEKVWTYKESNTLYVSVNLPSKNKIKNEKESFNIQVISEKEPDGEVIRVVESDVSSGLFKGEIQLYPANAPVPGNAKLEVENGDRLTVTYVLSKSDQGVETKIFDEAYYRGPDWFFVNTGQNHIVLIPDMAKITIDGKPIQKGDFISVFYPKTVDGKTTYENCGGMGRNTACAGVRYTGKTMTIAVWGSQPGQDNGLEANEQMQWRIWRASDGKVFDAVATYMPIVEGQPFSHQGNYGIDGISGITGLTAVSKK